MDPSTILVLRESGEVAGFSEHPEVMRVYPEHREYIDAYVPGSVVPGDEDDKRRFLRESEEKVKTVLTSKLSC